MTASSWNRNLLSIRNYWHIFPKLRPSFVLLSCHLSDTRCKNCILEPICPTCYGGNYITYGDVTKRDPYTCVITKIRALASSWMIGQMLENPEKFRALSELSNEELAMTAKGVILTQSFLEETGFMKELQNG